MKMITPIAIEDLNMESKIPEPDVVRGEVEFRQVEVTTESSVNIGAEINAEGGGEVVDTDQDADGNFYTFKVEVSGVVLVSKFTSSGSLIGSVTCAAPQYCAFDTSFTTGFVRDSEAFGPSIILTSTYSQAGVYDDACAIIIYQGVTYSGGNIAGEVVRKDNGLKDAIFLHSASSQLQDDEDNEVLHMTVLATSDYTSARMHGFRLSLQPNLSWDTTPLPNESCGALSGDVSERMNFYFIDRKGSDAYFNSSDVLIFTKYTGSEKSVYINKMSPTAKSRRSVHWVADLSEDCGFGFSTNTGYTVFSREVKNNEFTAHYIGANYVAKKSTGVTPAKAGTYWVSTATHRSYVALADTTDMPFDGVDLAVPTWADVGPTNKYAPFDNGINTKMLRSENNVNALYSFSPQQVVTTASFFGLSNVKYIVVEVRENDENGTLIYSKRANAALESPDFGDGINDPLLTDKLIFDDLPNYESPYISVNVVRENDGAGAFEVGSIVLGNARSLGVVNYQTQTSRTSYDTVKTDTFGNETIIKRPSAEYTSFDVSIQPRYAPYVERLLQMALNEPRVYVGDKENGEKIFTYGRYEISPIQYDNPALYATTLKVRGLV